MPLLAQLTETGSEQIVGTNCDANSLLQHSYLFYARVWQQWPNGQRAKVVFLIWRIHQSERQNGQFSDEFREGGLPGTHKKTIEVQKQLDGRHKQVRPIGINSQLGLSKWRQMGPKCETKWLRVRRHHSHSKETPHTQEGGSGAASTILGRLYGRPLMVGQFAFFLFTAPSSAGPPSLN